jgi:hypothetical protein
MCLMVTLMLKTPVAVVQLILYNEEGLVSSFLHHQEFVRIKHQETEL